MTPTENCLKKLKKEGYTCAIVEHWNPHAGIRQDLFGFIDVLSVKENEVLAVQVTSKKNVTARVKKILQHKNFLPVKQSGIKILIQGWSKEKEGKKLIYKSQDIYL